MNASISTSPQSNDWFRFALALVGIATLVRIMVLFGMSVPLFFDEAQYWTWAQDLGFGYYSKPPFIAWAIAATTAVCGEGEGCVRLSAPLFHAATAMMIFLIAQRLYDDRAAFWAAASYIFLPSVGVSAVIVSTDVFLLFFWAVALYSLDRAEQEPEGRWWVLLGAAFGFGLLSKYAMIFFLLGFAVYAIWHRDGHPVWRRPKLWAAFGLGGLIYLPNLIWNWRMGWPSYLHTQDNMNLVGERFNPGQALEFFGSQFGVFGPLLFAGLLCLVWIRLLRPGGAQILSREEKLLFAFSLPVIILILGQAFLSRAHANWAGTAYVAATVLVAGELSRLDRTVWLKASLVIHILASFILYNFDVLVRTFDVPLTVQSDPLSRMRGWDAGGQWASDLQRDFPDATFLFNDRTTMAEMIYYVRPHPFDAVMWNPKGQRNNHYEMTTDMNGKEGRDFIYVVRDDWPNAAGPSFAGSRLLSSFRNSAYPGHLFRLRAYYLTGFKGYGGE